MSLEKYLQGKTALVTGSTGGIGRGIAEKLASLGADIVLNGLGDAAEIEKQRLDLERAHGVRAVFIAADMRKGIEVENLAAKANTAMGKIDILINNAGIQHVARVENFSAAKWDEIIAINLSAAFHATRALLPAMQQRKYGRIVNVASVHGLVASKEKSAYVAAKHGIIGLTKVVALENAGSGITCNAVCPGFVLTPLVQKQVDDRAAAANISAEESARMLLAEKQPTQEFVSIAAVADMVAYLCSASADSITGSALTIDGGWTAQ